MKKLKNYRDFIQTFLVVVSFGTFLWSMFVLYDGTTDTMKKTQQMALKSIIWNENVPIPERASACDDYLELGYNSYTKEYCSKIVESD